MDFPIEIMFSHDQDLDESKGKIYLSKNGGLTISWYDCMDHVRNKITIDKDGLYKLSNMEEVLKIARNYIEREMKKEMQKLMLAEDIFDALETGKKTTIRKGRRDTQLGDLMFESVETNRQEVVNVINVHYCKLSNVYIGDLQNDGFKDHHDMWEQMKRFYPDITFDDEVTTIKFTRWEK